MAAVYIIAALLAAIVIAFALMCVRVRCLARRERKISRCDCIIVLGARVWPDGRMSNTLIYRCVRALEIMRMYPECRLIASGGRGSDEPVSEAEAMRTYFMRADIPEDRIIMEDQSRSTLENLRFSKKIMEAMGMETAMIVTSDYHAERALWMARDLGIDAAVAAAKSPEKIKSQVKATLKESVSWIKYMLTRKKNASR
ncbi:MAG: YdcF family protein [Clostridia bacterium]|nr:YdcF family protein [Clostridia bacterium]